MFNYLDALGSCVAQYAASREGRGWGLTRGQAASIVNTAEVLFIFDRARQRGVPTPSNVERHARVALCEAIPSHCRPADAGGRGEKSRFVTFGLLGLSLDPSAFREPPVILGVKWCLDWLLEHAEPDGWPEEAGGFVSTFQTTMAVRAAQEVRRSAESALREEVRREVLGKADEILAIGREGLLRHRLASGAWPSVTHVNRPSPSKTALALLALSAAGDGAHAIECERAADWLFENHERWVDRVEADPAVTGTQWSHLVYALGVQALARAGRDVLSRRFAPAWQLIVDNWDPLLASWKEPTAPPMASVRASYYAVSALDETLHRFSEDRLNRVVDDHRLGATEDVVHLVRSSPGEFALSWPTRGVDQINLKLTSVNRKLLEVLSGRGGEPAYWSASDIAASLDRAEAGIGKRVERLNAEIAQQTDNAASALVRASRGKGYRLAVDWVSLT